MVIHALEELDDGFRGHSRLLWAVDRSRWARRGCVAFFVGGFRGNGTLVQRYVPASRLACRRHRAADR